MKTKIVSIILSFILISNSINAQEKELELFNETFPKLGNELKCSTEAEATQIDSKTVKSFRVELKRLSGALDDINAYKYDALVDEAAKVFINKKLKRRDLKILTDLINSKRNKIIAYMGTLTKFGADSVYCQRMLSLFDQEYNSKNYNQAYKYWNFLYHFYPRSSLRLYARGTSIITTKYKEEKNEEIKEKWLDTLKQVYDQRMRFFNEKSKGFVLGKKGRDILKLNKKDLDDAYKILGESIDLEKEKSEELVLSDYMKATDELFKQKKIDAAKFVDNYNKVIELLNKRRSIVSDKDRIENTIKYIDLIFSKSDAASCDNIVEAYQAKFEKSPDDVQLLKKIIKILIDKKCNKTDLYFDIVVALDKAEPTAFSSYGIAKMYFFKKKYETSKKYFDKAISMETNDSLKAKYLYETAVVLTEMGKKIEARKKALEADEANELIRKYSRYPNKEKAVWLSIYAGTKITVGCWINESTKARF